MIPGGGAIAGNAIAGTGALRDSLTIPPVRSVRYRVTLTGLADALPDVDLPVSAISWRNSTTSQAYLSVVVPGLAFAGDIADRPNADLKAYYIATAPDGSSAEMLIGEVDLSEVRQDSGPNSQSITLTGYRQIINDAPRSIEAGAIMYANTTGAVSRWRLDIDPNIMPGDSVVNGSELLQVSQLAAYISATQSFLEIA